MRCRRLLACFKYTGDAAEWLERTVNTLLLSRSNFISVFVDIGFLHPPPSFNQVSHSWETIRTILLSERHPLCRRSRTVTRPSVWACLSALRAVVRLTPATAAIRSMNHVQEPLRWHSRAMTVKAAISPVVKLAAIVPGMAPDAAIRRRRAIDVALSGLLQGLGRARAGWAAFCRP